MFAKVLKLGFEQETQKRKTLKSWRAEKKLARKTCKR